MDTSKDRHKESKYLGWYTWVFVCIWTVIIAASILFNLVSVWKEFQGLARLEAMASINKDLAYRRWAAILGGVYVSPTEKTPPNPCLSHVPERDIMTTSGRCLTLVNPAYMTRQVHDLGREQYGLRGHITSLKPTRPETAPDPWEREALKAFEQGKNEVTSMEEMDGRSYFRFMRPFITEKGCLKCHARQGYKEGDIRGGISVSVPVEPYRAAARSQTIYLAAGHGVVWLLGLVGIFLGMWHLCRRIRQKEEAEEARDQYTLELEKTLKNIRTLRGLLPICASCKRIRDDKGYWRQVESYIREHSEAEFSHGICPECEKRLYPEFSEEEHAKEENKHG